MSILANTLKRLISKAGNRVPLANADQLQTTEIEQKEGGALVCFYGSSEGNALAEGTKAVMEPFTKLASRLVFIDLNSPGWVDQLTEVLSNPIWFAASAFGVGQDIQIISNGCTANLWESSGVPFVRLFGDTPAYFPDKHVAKFRNSINAYHDISHANFYRRRFRNPALSIVCPPIIIDYLPINKVDTVGKLNGKIIFTKNGNSPSRLIDYWNSALPPNLGSALQDLAEESIGRDWINKDPCLDDRLIQYFHKQSVDIASVPEVLCFLVAQLDDYLRRVKSTMIGEALLDLPVIIRGRFWDHVDMRGKRATYDPSSDVASTLPLIDQAPAIVDMSPNTQHTPHNRIWQAVGRGTAFLTNQIEYFNTTLPIAERCTFAFERDAIRNMVEHYATSPKDAVELGLEQAQFLRPVFADAPYVQTILTAVQITSMRMGPRPTGAQNFVDFPPKAYSY